MYPWLGAPIRASPCCEACKMNQGFRLGGGIPICTKIDMMYCGRPKTEAWTHKATVLGLAGQMHSPGNVRCPNRHSYVFTMINNETRRDAGAGRNRHDSLPISQKKCPPAVACDDRTPLSNLLHRLFISLVEGRGLEMVFCVCWRSGASSRCNGIPALPLVKLRF